MNNLLLDSHPVIVLPELAQAVGLNEAVILQQIHYWVMQNKKVHRNNRDGFYWAYNSYDAWQKQFPWWSVKTIKRIFASLESKGFIVSGNYNKIKMDRTKWYRINYDTLNGFLPLGQNDPMERDRLTPPIPETINKDIEYKNMRNVHSCGIDVLSSFEKQDNIFQSITKQHSEDRVRYVLGIVDWYIDTAYSTHTGKKHPHESKAKRMVFARKLLACADETYLEDNLIADALVRAINNYNKSVDPTIYWVTTPTVLGYWLIRDEDISYESVNDTEYAPVESVY